MQRCPNNSNLNLNLISLKINNKHSVITTKKKILEVDFLNFAQAPNISQRKTRIQENEESGCQEFQTGTQIIQ